MTEEFVNSLRRDMSDPYGPTFYQISEVQWKRICRLEEGFRLLHLNCLNDGLTVFEHFIVAALEHPDAFLELLLDHGRGLEYQPAAARP